MAEWTGLCEQAAAGDGYDLMEYRPPLKRPPRGIVRDREDGIGFYYATRNDILYVEPTDLEPEEFAKWLVDYQGGLN